MRATVMHAAGDVRIENVPDAAIAEPTDAVIRVVRACICGSDLWPYRSMARSDRGQPMGHEAIERVRQLTRGHGVHAILECVGLAQAMQTAVAITRAGGAIGRVGVPQDVGMPGSQTAFYHNVTVGGGPAPVRTYIPGLLPDILEGRIQPGRVFDRTVDLDGVPGRYRDMNDRKALKVMVQP